MHKRQFGVGLVEVMIAVALGAFLIAGIVEIVVTIRQTSRVQEAAARIQENARFAEAMIARMVRSAGYRAQPEADLASVFVPSLTTASPVPVALAAGQVIAGTNDNANSGDGVRDGTDTLTVRYEGAEDGSSRNCLGSRVNANSIAVDTFFVADSSPFELLCRPLIFDNSGVIASQAEPLVGGVEDFQVIFGIDIDNDPALPEPDCFVDASRVVATPVGSCNAGVNFNQVVGVRYGILYHSPGDQGRFLALDDDARTYEVLGPTISNTVADTSERRLRQVFSSVAGLRNKLK